jgi:hypothetical protein
MEHKQYRELLSLSVFDELEKEQAGLLEEHLHTCEACRTELGELRKMHSILEKKRLAVPSAQFLQEARAQLRSALKKEQQSRTFWQEWSGSIATWWRELKWSPQYATVLAGIFTFAIGLLVGSSSLINHSPPKQEIASKKVAANEVTPNEIAPTSATFATTSSDIANVRFVDSDTTDGNVEIAFDAVKPMTLKGSINDPAIQKVLTYAVLKEQNPGVRLKAVNAIGAQQQQSQSSADPRLKSAVISALKFDKNAGVRKEALVILQKFPMDEETKAAFLDVLTHDENPGMRVAAMKYLESQELVDPEVLNVMKGKAQTDQNAFVRNRAILVTDEVKQ